MKREREIACLSLGKVTGPKTDTSLGILKTQIVRDDYSNCEVLSKGWPD
jgi:hypothetical protein